MESPVVVFSSVIDIIKTTVNPFHGLGRVRISRVYVQVRHAAFFLDQPVSLKGSGRAAALAAQVLA